MSQADAISVCDAAKKALDLCSPRPVIDPKAIVSRDGSGFVVAINCDAYAAPPIGVAKLGQDGGEKWWAFPARRGRDNHNLRPEELATIMEPRLRRMTLLLDRIPPLAAHDRPRRAHFACASGRQLTLDILKIDYQSLVLHLREAGKSLEVFIPIDAVKMVWKDLATRSFKVAIAGEILPSHDNSGLARTIAAVLARFPS
jgi:hypothetical protein